MSALVVLGALTFRALPPATLPTTTQPATSTADAGRHHRALARSSPRTVRNAASGTLGVRLQLPNPDNKIPAGIRCSVVFGQ